MSYIFCDPVLACITVIPVLLLHRLPILVEDFLCLEHPVVDNDSCLNRSSIAMSHAELRNISTQLRSTLQDGVVSFHWSFDVLVCLVAYS